MNFKGLPKVLQLVNEELSEIFTDMIVSIGMSNLNTVPMLITSPVSTMLINSTLGVNISYLSSEKRLEVAERILEEL